MGETYLCHYRSPLGRIELESDGEFLTGLWFEGGRHAFGELPDQAKSNGISAFALTEQWLDCYFEGGLPAFTPPIRAEGSAFDKRVWAMLLEIPYGATVTYGTLAKRLMEAAGGRMAAQAVGGAVGRNPISVIIPCHRVVGADGNLTGYGGGLPKKLMLLQLEGVDTHSMRMPRASRDL